MRNTLAYNCRFGLVLIAAITLAVGCSRTSQTRSNDSEGSAPIPGAGSAEPNLDELQPGWGIFEGSISLTMLELEGGKQVVHPFPTFHTVPGKVRWKRSDGTVHSMKVDSAVPWRTETQLRLYDSAMEEMVRGLVLLDFHYLQNNHFYKGRIEELR